MATRVGVRNQFNFEQAKEDSNRQTLICFSHLRWDFVFQRPQHLMSRFAREMAVIFWEEPVEIPRGEKAHLKVKEANDAPGVRVVTPHLPRGLGECQQEDLLKQLLDDFTASLSGLLIAWYYTPMMLPFSRRLDADAVVFDAMDELSKFKFAPPRLLELEEDLPRPRLGFFGVIDERFDADLLAKAAELRPDWQFIMVGPVIKISEADLPRRPNIHYLGSKSYAELPRYLSGWDVALMPFAMNESTEFISPTKTPEYLAGGRPVVSTPVRDVVRHYGHLQGVRIAAQPDQFVAACEELLELRKDESNDWLAEADLLLSATSWDVTQARMSGLIRQLLCANEAADSLLVAAQ
jgi:UDP-galactopyranose mutase